MKPVIIQVLDISNPNQPKRMLQTESFDKSKDEALEGVIFGFDHFSTMEMLSKQKTNSSNWLDET